MKVYLVMRGDIYAPDALEVAKVFLNEEKAEAYCKIHGYEFAVEHDVEE